MVIYGEGTYWIIKFLLSKGLALTFLIAFTVALRQYRGLAGENGILPVENFTENESFWDSISLFHIFPSNAAMKASSWMGIFLSVSTLFGIPSMFSPILSSFTWFLMWFLFLSFVNTGQKFYEHGWELILLEAGFLAIFLGGINTQMSEILVWLFRWLLFRMMLGSGLVKLHGDKAWKDLSALKYHFETQPFPNPLSWYYHHLPEVFLKIGVIITHFLLLVVPFFYFAPQPYAAAAGMLTILYQIIIFSSGNYTWLNLITTVLAFSTFSDEVLSFLPPLITASPEVSVYPYGDQAMLLTGIICILSLPVVKNMFSPDQVQNQTYDPLHLVNSYGAFKHVKKERKEIILESTEEKNPTDSAWEEYIHYEKPGPKEKIPPQVSPYHHRLDYPFKFANKEPGKESEWVEGLAYKLVEREKEVEALFKHIPFDEPVKVRASFYSYRFTSPEERSETGDWWRRERIKTLFKIEK